MTGQQGWPPAGQPSEASLDQRRMVLGTAVAGEVANGARVESRSDVDAVLVFGRRPNHTLHLILTLVTAGLWGLVWIPVAVLVRERRVVLQVDPWGRVLRQG